MKTTDPKSYLWSNICSLMGEPDPSIRSVTKKTGVGQGTIQRIKEGSTSVGLDVITSIAVSFGLEPWQLLVAGLDNQKLPRLGETKVVSALPLSSEVIAALANADAALRSKADALLRVEFSLPPQANNTEQSKAA